MKVLVKSAKVIDQQSPFHNQVVDILIDNGTIAEIGANLKVSRVDQEIKFEHLHVSRGWFDSSVSFGEPGWEERETLLNGLRTAQKSGFTAVALNPGNNPVTDNKGAVSFLLSKAATNPVNLYPIGSLTKDSKGIDLAELYDMKLAGAVAFNDYKKAVRHPNLLKIALQYVQNFNGLILSYPQEDKIATDGLVNEHENSTYLGLKGIPSLAEELQITRDLYILEYTGGKLHIPTISTKKSVEIIRDAKAKGLDVSCSVAVHNLFFSDDILQEFNTNAKVLPPLRTKEDSAALLKGLEDGTIDMVTSDHYPIDIENKKVEFDHALFGTIGLESVFGALLKLTTLETTIKSLTSGRARFNIQEFSIEQGSLADLSFFNPDLKYNFSNQQIFSSSKNSIFLNQELQGAVLGTFAKGIYSPTSTETQPK